MTTIATIATTPANGQASLLPASTDPTIGRVSLLDRSVGYRGGDGSVSFSGAPTLLEVREQLEQLHDAMRPWDLVRSPSTMHFDWRGGRQRDQAHTLQAINPGGMGEPLRFTHGALGQLGNTVLPPRGLNFLHHLAEASPRGADLAQVNMATFMRATAKPYTFRVANLPDEQGVWAPTVRGVVGGSYPAIDDREIVDMLLGMPDLAQLPVLACTVTDMGLRLRMALDPVAADAVQSGTMIPMLEVWNSETGHSSVVLRSGTFRVRCLNGLHSITRNGGEARWRHQGDTAKIKAGIEGSVNGLVVEARGIMDLYDQALGTSVDDMLGWLDAELAEQLPATQRRAVVQCLADPSTTPGNTLASAVDAVTLAAQRTTDLWAQAGIEAAGGRLLRRGLGQAQRGRILAEA